MTRLKAADISKITGDLGTYDDRLRRILGVSLGELACRAAGVKSTADTGMIERIRVTAVPMTCGQGIITNFSRTLCDIAELLGFTSAVTSRSDVAGLAEAYEKQTDVILCADDSRFIALNTRTGRVVDNSQATGRGFAHGLDLLAGGLAGKPVLVIGCGPVGRSGARALMDLGGKVTVYDTDPQRCLKFAVENHDGAVQTSTELKSALAGHDLVFEATPTADIIGPESIGEATYIAAPGVPCGVDKEGRKLLGARLLWDPLQIGVATMLMEAALTE